MRKRKLSTREFDRKFAEIGTEYLSTLSPKEREKRLKAFERAVLRKSADETHARALDSCERQETSCLARTR